MTPENITISTSNQEWTHAPSEKNDFEKISIPLTLTEIERALHVYDDTQGRRHLPLSPKLLTIALQEEPNEIFESREAIYSVLKPHWTNLEEVDNTVPDPYQQTNKHAERTAHHVFRTCMLYQLAHDLQTKDPLVEIHKNTLAEIPFTQDHYQKGIKAGFAALLHDIGKSNVLGVDAKNNKIFQQRDILISAEKYTEEQRTRMKQHCPEGQRIITEIGLPNYFAHVANNHHNVPESFKKNGATATRLSSKTFVTLVTKIYDQFDAATSERPYKKKTPLHPMHTDPWIQAQLKFYDDPVLIAVYHSYITLLAGEQAQHSS